MQLLGDDWKRNYGKVSDLAIVEASREGWCLGRIKGQGFNLSHSTWWHALAECQAARHFLAEAIQQTSRTAQSILAALKKQPPSTNTRHFTILLIHAHNRVDVYKLLDDSCRVIEDNAKQLSFSSLLPMDNNKKVIISAMANLAFATVYLRPALAPVDALVFYFRQCHGDKFITSLQRNNNGCIVNERLVTKLTKPIDETLFQQYAIAILDTITTTATTEPNNLSRPNMPQRRPTTTNNTSANPAASRPQKSSTLSSSSTCSVVSISRLSPTLPIYFFRPNPRLEIVFDVRTKNPVYVMEHRFQPSCHNNNNNNNNNTNSGNKRRYAFYEESKLLPVEYRSRLASFLHSSHDRGHLAPAANFGDASVKDTFNLCNVSPQNPTMNRSIWVKLEHWCRNVSDRELAANGRLGETSKSTSVHIVTGPLWLPNKSTKGKALNHFEYEAIGKGDSLVHVPTHFFKVIVVLVNDIDSSKKKIQKFACFLVPNAKPPKFGGGACLNDYLVEWNRLEAISGLHFFPHLVNAQWKVEAKRATEATLKMARPATDASAPQKTPSIRPVASLTMQLEHLRISWHKQQGSTIDYGVF